MEFEKQKEIDIYKRDTETVLDLHQKTYKHMTTVYIMQKQEWETQLCFVLFCLISLYKVLYLNDLHFHSFFYWAKEMNLKFEKGRPIGLKMYLRYTFEILWKGK